MAVNEAVSIERPEVIGLGICRGYTTGLMGGVHLVLRAESFESISWWKVGVETTVLVSVNQEAIHVSAKSLAVIERSNNPCQ